MKKEYRITVTFTGFGHASVYAESPEEAKDLYLEGEAMWLDDEEWTDAYVEYVEEVSIG